ncbi:related to TFIID and SAGA subunit [Cephalotrichum gorgonifer]|uniref:Related to TFIID and SAGA subunit n=1 Tax=Cephalotrichum gorgonifer TaxID=2041049 RepID=A0AAE8SV18_9PEZI|nr:related to TFIID and SAGA subunit [Cephalotrichum gorgonifer]
MSSAAPQTNGVPGASQSTQPTQPTTDSQPTQPTALQPSQQQRAAPAPQTPASTASASRPRDARMLELLLTSQGVTSYESRVPLLLMDFAYRHTSSILNDALHLSVDPHTTAAGARASSTSGATATLIGPDATVSANAVRLAIASRQGYQFRGGNAAGGISKEWLQELAKERNKVGLPRVPPNEWAVRLPSERFVLSGLSWGLRDVLAGGEDDEDEDEEMEDVAMDGIAAPAVEDVGGEDVEGGTIDDVFGDEMDEDDQATA